jgi:hypothetical protein
MIQTTARFSQETMQPLLNLSRKSTPRFAEVAVFGRDQASRSTYFAHFFVIAADLRGPAMTNGRWAQGEMPPLVARTSAHTCGYGVIHLPALIRIKLQAVGKD